MPPDSVHRPYKRTVGPTQDGSHWRKTDHIEKLPFIVQKRGIRCWSDAAHSEFG